MGDTEEIAMVDLDLSLLLVVRGSLGDAGLHPFVYHNYLPFGKREILAIYTRKEQLWVLSGANQSSVNDWMTEILIQSNAKLWRDELSDFSVHIKSLMSPLLRQSTIDDLSLVYG